VYFSGFGNGNNRGESKLALPFSRDESFSVFASLLGRVDESKSTGRDRVSARRNPCSQGTVGQETQSKSRGI
jgi:hypothetical protein